MTTERPIAVGREGVLQTLLDDAELVLEGQARTVLILGEPGIGKSRILSDFAPRASGLGFQLLEAAANPRDRDIAFATLRSFAHGIETVTREDPGLAEYAEALSATTRSIGPAGEGRRSSSVVYSLVAELLERVTRERPVLVLLDDVQFADAETLAAVELTIRRLAPRPLMVVIAARIDAWNSDAGFAAALGPLTTEMRGRTIELGRLGEDHLVELLRQELSAEPSDGLVNYVSRRSGGNPLFAIAIVRVLEQSESLSRRGDAVYLIPVADSLQVSGRAAILQRFFAGDPDGRTLGQVLALAGPVRLNTVPLLFDAAGLPSDRGRVAFDRLVQSGVIEENEQGQFVFEHALVAELLRDDLGPLERKQLHREILGQLPKPTNDAERARRARHLVASADRGDTNAVDEAIWMAISMSSSGPLAAAKWYEQALLLTDPDDRIRMSTARMGLVTALWKGSRPRQALAVGEAALADEKESVRRRTLWSILIGVAYASGDYPRAIELGNRAMTEFPGEIRLESQVCASLATTGHTPELDRLLPSLRAGLARPGGSLDELTLSHVGFVGQITGDRALYDLAQSRLEAILSASESSGLRSDRTISAAESLAYITAQSGDTDTAVRALTYLKGDPEHGALDMGGQRSTAEAVCSVARGEVDQALEIIRSVSATLERVGITANSAWLRALEAEIHLERDAPELAYRCLAEQGVYLRRTRAGMVARVLRERAEAAIQERRLDRPLVVESLDMARDARWVATMRVALLALIDDSLAAGESSGEFATELDRLARACRYPNLEFSASLVAVRRDGDISSAAALVERSAAQRHAVRILKSGWELRRLAPTHDLLTRISLADLECRMGFVRVPHASGAPVAPTPRGPDALTPRDQELVDLVRAGLNNREIAERLHFSRKTIEAHLSRLYRRFGCTSRVSLVVELTRRGLLDERSR